MWAAHEGQVETVASFVDKGADLEAKDNAVGMTALLSATTRDRTEVVKLLLAGGADVNATVRDGKTALMLAAYIGFPEKAQLLLEAGADVNAQDNEMMRPFVVSP